MSTKPWDVVDFEPVVATYRVSICSPRSGEIFHPSQGRYLCPDSIDERFVQPDRLQVEKALDKKGSVRIEGDRLIVDLALMEGSVQEAFALARSGASIGRVWVDAVLQTQTGDCSIDMNTDCQFVSVYSYDINLYVEIEYEGGL
jgi:hypothetical protein